LATLVAFVVFSARRRQRVIPVIKPPVNHMMDFVKRIGGIYYKRHDNVDLLIKKYVTFINDLRAKAMIDIDNYDNLDDELMSLSNRTGIPYNELQQQIRDVMVATNEDSISDERLKRLIDVMNDIMYRINI
jgi:flagellar motor component MotA